MVNIEESDPRFFILKPWSWMDVDTFEEKIFGAIVKQFTKPTTARVPLQVSPVEEYNREVVIDNNSPISF